jgi:hypothetical protein
VATRQQVQQLLDAGLDYEAAGRRLGIPAGQAYMIATGTAADGGDTLPGQARQRGGVVTASQHLANPPAKNPTSSEEVRDWIAARVAADPQMRAAHQKAQQKNS